MINIMVIEDDVSTRKLIHFLLKASQFTVVEAENGDDALELLSKNKIDLFIVDLMMNGIDGFQFTKIIRETDTTTPILILTAKTSIMDKRKCFDLGADDYLTKPFEREELILRVRALLRRANINMSHKIVIGNVTLDYDGLEITRGEEKMVLPKKEFYLLYKLLSYPDQVFTKDQLMSDIWGMDSDTDENTIKVHINRLRNRFESFTEFEIQTVRGLGYKAVRKDETK